MKHQVIALHGERSDVTLTTYVLDDSMETLCGKKRPAVLICPGGGYLYCSDREAEPVAMRFVAMGYHAFVLRYTVYYKPGEEIAYDRKLSVRQGTAHPAPVRDVALAMKCIHEHAEEWLVDTNRIFLSGFSGGASNCAMYGCLWNKAVITDYISVPGGLRPAAVVLGYGAYDNRRDGSTAPVIKYPDLMEAYYVSFCGSADPDDRMREATSPVCLADESFPPAFLWTTYNDDAVPQMQTISFAARLTELGVPVELHMFEIGIHGLSIANQATAVSLSTVVPQVGVWVDMADKWLQQRFTLPLPAKTIWE